MTTLKILAVDDDEIVLSLLSELLSRAGYADVKTCTSPKEALDLVRRDANSFDCFLLDIQMPGMDGIELCRAIRRTRGYDTTPILMLTAMSDKSYVDRAFSAGATDYLTKPFDPTEVAVRLGLARQLTEERKMLSQNAEIIDSFIEVLDETTRHDLADAIDLGKMEGVLSYPAFENYLYQSGRSVLFLATVFAVKVKTVKNWHHKLPPLEFKELLRQSAQEIVSRLKDQNVFLSYRGDGEFVGVIPRSGSKALKSLGDTIRIDVSESEGKYGASLPGTLSLVVGSPVANRLPTRGGILANIWSALEKVREKTVQASAHAPTGTAQGGSNPYSGTKSSEEARQQVLKEEFQDLLEDKLRNEVGEKLIRQTPAERAEVSLFRFQSRKKAMAQPKEKILFGRASAPSQLKVASQTKTTPVTAPDDSTLSEVET